MSFIFQTVIGVSASLIVNTIYNYCKSEYFGTNPPMTAKINREMMTPSGTSYSVNGNYQSNLSPRFINTNVGANIRYHLPPPGVLPDSNGVNRRVPVETRPTIIDPPPSASSAPSLATGRRLMNERHITMDAPSTSVNNMRQIQREYINVTDLLPVTDRAVHDETMQRQGPGGKMGPMGSMVEDEQPIIYDRFMFANSKSNLRGQSDPFRGDLPIVPVLPQSSPDSGVWFRPSVTPHIDLGRGYLSVAGGFDNDSNNKLRQLMIASSGGTLETFGGDNIRLQRNLVNNSSGDLMVTAFV